MHRLKLYGLLVGLTITILLICDVLAFKVVTICGYDFSASGLIFPLGFLLSSITTEVYGFALAGRIIWVQVMCQILFIVTINIFVFLPSSDALTITLHYLTLYHHFWHVLIGSTIGLVSAYFVNDVVMSKLKLYLSGKYFILRFLISNATGSAILVLIAYPINFHELYPMNHIMMIAFDTWIYKLLFSVVLLPIAQFLANVIKKIERVDYFDYGVSYNLMTVFNDHFSGRNKFENEGRAHENYSAN